MELAAMFGEIGQMPCRLVLPARPGSDDLLTITEVAARLKTDVKTIYSLTRNRRAHRGLLPLPHLKIGRKLYFRWSDVRAWLDRQPGYRLPEQETKQ